MHSVLSVVTPGTSVPQFDTDRAAVGVCVPCAFALVQREAREKVKELSKRIGVNNAQRLAASPPAKPPAKEPSARQRAVEYAKASVPKPELLKQRSSLHKRGGSAPAATGGSSGQVSRCTEFPDLAP
jgi:hypothetical protein